MTCWEAVRASLSAAQFSPRSARSRRIDGRALVTQGPAVITQPDILDRGLTADPTTRIVVMDGMVPYRRRVVEDGSWIVMDRHGGGPYPHRAVDNANGPTTSVFTCPGSYALAGLISTARKSHGSVFGPRSFRVTGTPTSVGAFTYCSQSVQSVPSVSS
jgi:hypothetical protein